MIGRYYPNPGRGCGTKKENAWYLEGSLFSADGPLWAWTWLLGDGVENLFFLGFPPRGMELINPAATIALREKVLDKPEFHPFGDREREEYNRMRQATRTLGLGDHVGKQHYTPYSFANEVSHYGPSRRVPEKIAIALNETMRERGAIPIIFTHSEMPIFDTYEKAEEARDIIEALYPDVVNWNDLNYEPTWIHADFGQYAEREQYTGSDHWLTRVLRAMNDLKNGYLEGSQAALDARSFFATLRYREQALGMSWITGVTYTLPKGDKFTAAAEAAAKAPGVNILDLDTAPEYIEYDSEETDNG